MTKQQQPSNANGTKGRNNGGVYEVRIKGHLDDQWLEWFEGMTLRCVHDEQTGLELTEIRGIISDQPALHGLLAKIRDLNLTLISIRRLNPDDAGAPGGDENVRSPDDNQH